MKGFLNEMPWCVFRKKISDNQTLNGCLLLLIPFLSGSDSVASGTVNVHSVRINTISVRQGHMGKCSPGSPTYRALLGRVGPGMGGGVLLGRGAALLERVPCEELWVCSGMNKM